MGIYHEYLNKQLDQQQLDRERKAQLRRIGELRSSHVLTYAARMATLPIRLPISIDYEDLLPFVDMLDGMKGKRITILLETPGGVGEAGREMVENLHERFEHITFVIPGWAKSTGTIMVMGGHEIMMWSGSSLGPIDAQILQEGKQFSADAFLKGLDRIKEEVEANHGKLNPAYIPILQRISPGEIENARNALEFAKRTVADWLTRYKFCNWTHHSSNGQPVTAEEKTARAYEISTELSSQSRWFTHGRSLRIADLKELRLRVTALEEHPELLDAVRRYHVLLRMTFDSGNAFKIFETPDSTVARRFNVASPPPAQLAALAGQQPLAVHIDVNCTKCHQTTKVQLDFNKGLPLQAGAVRYPNSGTLPCPKCKTALNLQPARADVEKQIGRPALSPQPEN